MTDDPPFDERAKRKFDKLLEAMVTKPPLVQAPQKRGPKPRTSGAARDESCADTRTQTGSSENISPKHARAFRKPRASRSTKTPPKS